MFLRQEWYDFRLVHEEHGTLPLRGTDLDKIWRPDTYFTNNNDYKLYEDNQLALISKKGYVYYSARYVQKEGDKAATGRDHPADTFNSPWTFSPHSNPYYNKSPQV